MRIWMQHGPAAPQLVCKAGDKKSCQLFLLVI
jgi:hypothetical protein